MIKLFSLKQKAEEDAKSAADGKPKTAPGLIRMQKGAPRARRRRRRRPPATLRSAAAGAAAARRSAAARRASLLFSSPASQTSRSSRWSRR